MIYFHPRVMWQLDPKWKDVHLGTPQAAANSTIGKYGCLVTCIAYLANAAEGADIYTPVDVQNKLLNVGGLVGDSFNLVNFSSVTQVFPNLKFTNIVNTPGPLKAADFANLKSRLDLGVPVIIGVDYTKTNQKKPNHYIALTDLMYEQVSVNTLNPASKTINGSIADPYYGDLAKIAPRYGDTLSHAILRYILYDFTVPLASDLLDEANQERHSPLPGATGENP